MTTPNKQLSNDDRKLLAAKLAVKAVSKHAKAMLRLTTSLQTRLQERHLKGLAEIRLDFKEADWDHLMQMGVLRCSTNYGLYRVVYNEDGTVSRGNGALPYYNLGNFSRDMNQRKADQEQFSLLRRLLREDPAWDQTLDSFDSGELRDSTPELKFRVKLSKTLPSWNGCDTLDTASAEDKRLLRDLDAVCLRLAKVINQGFEYQKECLDLLQGFRNTRQLEDAFPAAAKLLPPPPPKRTQALLPVEHAAKLTRMLETGVPEE